MQVTALVGGRADVEGAHRVGVVDEDLPHGVRDARRRHLLVQSLVQVVEGQVGAVVTGQQQAGGGVQGVGGPAQCLLPRLRPQAGAAAQVQVDLVQAAQHVLGQRLVVARAPGVHGPCDEGGGLGRAPAAHALLKSSSNWGAAARYSATPRLPDRASLTAALILGSSVWRRARASSASLQVRSTRTTEASRSTSRPERSTSPPGSSSAAERAPKRMC